MPDSNITKRALASAMQELIETTPFDKITVSQICEKCGMNRKSFYYHFKDKYDLVNWIFDTDFITLVKEHSADTWDFLEHLCCYFYEKRDFYRKVLKIHGQNSFYEHFEEIMNPLVRKHLELIIGQKNIHPICIAFITDGIICSLRRWLMDKDCLPPDQFLPIIKSLVEGIVVGLYQEMDPANSSDLKNHSPD